MRTRRTKLAVVILLLATGTATAQEGPRTALVIGNGAYQHLGALTNPANDARDVGAALATLGFSVTMLIDATLSEMDEAVFAFGRDLGARGGVGLFYYAGHGVEAGGVNYLVPVEQSIRAERELRYKAVAVNRVLDEMEAARNGTNIVILDACRDNPLPPEARSTSSGRGLSVVQAPSGSLVVYATSPGNVAQDGRGRNGVFTGALLEHIATPGLNVMDMLVEVRRDVMSVTRNEQTPWENSSLVGQFFFAGPSGASPPAEAPQPEPTPSPPTRPTLRITPSFGSVALTVRTGGDLYLDGDLLGTLAAEQDATIDGVPTGRRSLEMRYDGEIETLTVTVAADATVDVSFVWEPPPPTGSLRVTTTPAGASVFVDNRYRGRTPLTVEDLPPGIVAYRITLAGHTDVEGTRVIGSGRTAAVAETLVPPTGSLAITSDPPGAAVTVGGTRRGVTPLTVENLAPGRIGYTLTLDGYQDETGEATVTAGAVTNARVAMTSAIPRDGLVAEYLFAGNASDTSGNGNHGTVYGATLTADRFGNARAAYAFDGRDDYVDLGAWANVEVRTIALWFRNQAPVDPTLSDVMTLICRDTSNEVDEFWLAFIKNSWPDPGKIGFSHDQGGVLSSSSFWPVGWWSIVAVIGAGPNQRVFVNGELQEATHPSVAPIAPRIESIAIARWGHSDIRYFTGLIDDVRVYNRALTEAEVLALYHEGGWDR